MSEATKGKVSVILKAASEELLANTKVLSNFLEVDEIPGFEFEDGDLNRAKADAEDAETLSRVSADTNVYAMASVLTRINEEHRIRRDKRITDIGHRGLLLSGLRILGMRNENLELLIQKEAERPSI